MTSSGKSPFDEREWQAQERALRDERAGSVSVVDDPAVASYRRVAQALRRAPAAALPADFAGQVARLAAMRPRPVTAGAAFEAIALRMLVVALFASGAVVLALYARPLLELARAGIGGDGLGWTFALASCIGASWTFDALRRMRREDEFLRVA